MRPEDIQRNLEDYNRPVQNDRSIDDCLDNTNAFVQWAQRKAPQYDPENRQPLPVRIQYIYPLLLVFFTQFVS